MSNCFGTHGPSHPLLGSAVYTAAVPAAKLLLQSRGYHSLQGRAAEERLTSVRRKLKRGQSVYLAGIGTGSHNAGIALVEASLETGVRLICNNEEERFSGIKHCGGHPALSIGAMREQISQLGLSPADIDAYLGTFNYPVALASTLRCLAEELPRSTALLSRRAFPGLEPDEMLEMLRTPTLLKEQLNLAEIPPVIGLDHHRCHASFAYAASPFALSAEPTVVTVIDGSGDDTAISFYIGLKGNVRLLSRIKGVFESLGALYRVLSSTQGGWMPMSSEGRFMGASAWGNNSRLTNPYYRQLRQLLFFGPEGEVFLNRALANWHVAKLARPYSPMLVKMLGDPIPVEKMWNPDSVLSVENIHHPDIIQQRLDKAAATQMVFEDALLHLVGHVIRRSGIRQLVLTGGTALNCLANMRLLEAFDEEFYERYRPGRPGSRLQIWVPPIPGDAGAPPGAAFRFAMLAGAPPGPPLQHAFYCGLGCAGSAVSEALLTATDVSHASFGNVRSSWRRAKLADLMAFLVSKDAVIGIFHGIAETGPRALGHRSILANPCNPRTRDEINRRVKFREPIRPLAPMTTLEASQSLFELSAGASADGYNAYNYMVLTARARPEAHDRIPAVIHKDGTGRVQIVRRETDPLMHEFLMALDRRLGVAVSVNTSLNVASPIAQTPAQALGTLRRAKGMDGLFLVDDRGEAVVAWHNVYAPPKDAGRRLVELIRTWAASEEVAEAPQVSPFS